MRLAAQQVTFHVILRGFGQVCSEQRQDQSIWLSSVTLFYVFHMWQQRVTLFQPGDQLGRRRQVAGTYAQVAGQVLQGSAVIFHGQAAVQA